jgi:endonuclease-3
VLHRTVLSSLEGKANNVEELFTAYYGARPYRPEMYEQDILGALIATILSQHTSDLNSGRAYLSLKAAFPNDWTAVCAAPVSEVADVLRSGGLADVKAARIQRIIREVMERTGAASLDFLRSWRDEQAIIEFLKSFHGVGPKTAACISMFNLGRPVIPVDTHVHRVASRLGLIGLRVSADQAHEDLLKLVKRDDAYSFHVHLIEHGRTICRARNPGCSKCPAANFCDFYATKSLC